MSFLFLFFLEKQGILNTDKKKKNKKHILNELIPCSPWGKKTSHSIINYLDKNVNGGLIALEK